MENVRSDEVEIGSLSIFAENSRAIFPNRILVSLVIPICVFIPVIYIYRRIAECCLNVVLVAVTVSAPTIPFCIHHKC